MNIDFSKKEGNITFNDFSLNKDISLDIQRTSLKEDMLQVAFPNGYILDVGWRPSFDVNGEFYIYLIKDFNWEEPIYSSNAKNIHFLEIEINQALDNMGKEKQQ